MDFILADCVVCGRETDAYDGDPHPRCMSCFDKGLSAKWKSSMDPERIARAKKMYADRKTVIHISQVLRASPTMVRVWLGLQSVRNEPVEGEKNGNKYGPNRAISAQDRLHGEVLDLDGGTHARLRAIRDR